MPNHPETCPSSIISDKLCMARSKDTSGHHRRYLPPLPLAEQCCPTALLQQIDHETTWPGASSHFNRLVRRAWAEAEMGLALPVHDQVATDHLEAAGLLLQDVLYGEEAPFQDAFDAAILEAYMGDLKVRHGQFNPMTHQVRQRDLGQLVQRLDKASMPIERRSALEVKLAAHMIFGRSKLNYYPGSSREARAWERRYYPLNHEGYIILDERKIPINPLTESMPTKNFQNDAEVVNLPLRGLAAEVIEEVRGHRSIGTQAIVETLDMLTREASGDQRQYESSFLNRLTEKAVQKVMDFATVRATKK